MSLLMLFLVAYCVGIAAATDYCDSSLCRDGTHIACGHNGTFAAACPADATMVTFDPALQSFVVSTHNAKRNFVAGGADANHTAACRMATIQWDDELAALAMLNVRQCAMRHDSCRNTATFRYSGQNLAWLGYFEPRNNQELALKAILLWYDEIQHSRMEFIDAYPRNYHGPTIGHFTVMMAERNTRLGCGAVTYSILNAAYKVFLMSCNYATTNILGQRIYATCSKPAADCASGSNLHYNNLCSVAEDYSALF